MAWLLRIVTLGLAGFAVCTPTLAWTAETQVRIGEEAARLTAPDLYRQIHRHEAAFRRGLLLPFDGSSSEQQFRNPDGEGSLDRRIEIEVERAVRMIEEHHPFTDIVEQLGIVSHFVALADNPLRTSDLDRWEYQYFDDYADYVDSALDRLPVIFYGLDSQLERGDLPAFVRSVLDRGRRLYPSIAAEYRRIGKLPGSRYFDDRSTAFGVSSVAYSRAISDVALVLRFVWIEAGGTDPRPAPREEEGRLLVVGGDPSSDRAPDPELDAPPLRYPTRER